MGRRNQLKPSRYRVGSRWRGRRGAPVFLTDGFRKRDLAPGRMGVRLSSRFRRTHGGDRFNRERMSKFRNLAR